MNEVAYSSPFIPPEWIAAHGLRPVWAPLTGARDFRAGQCAAACVPMPAGCCAAEMGLPVAAIVMATACDQMRRAAAEIESHGRRPCFLLNVPATWQTAAARDLYHHELERLGRFLLQIGGQTPSAARLTQIMLDYDRDRASLRSGAHGGSARQLAEMVLKLRCGGMYEPGPGCHCWLVQQCGANRGNRVSPAPRFQRPVRFNRWPALATRFWPFRFTRAPAAGSCWTAPNSACAPCPGARCRRLPPRPAGRVGRRLF